MAASVVAADAASILRSTTETSVLLKASRYFGWDVLIFVCYAAISPYVLLIRLLSPFSLFKADVDGTAAALMAAVQVGVEVRPMNAEDRSGANDEDTEYLASLRSCNAAGGF